MTRDEMIEVMWDALKRSRCATPADTPEFAKVKNVLLVRRPDISAALSALESAGYVVVPKEPTPKMLVNGAAAARDFYSEQGPYPRSRAVWTAMLSASRQEKTDG